MAKKLTRTQERLLERMWAAVADGPWDTLPDPLAVLTVRYGEVNLPTPDYLKPSWPFDTWDRYVFVTLMRSGALVRVHRAPWVTASTSSVSYRKAFEVLDDPASVW